MYQIYSRQSKKDFRQTPYIPLASSAFQNALKFLKLSILKNKRWCSAWVFFPMNNDNQINLNLKIQIIPKQNLLQFNQQKSNLPIPNLSHQQQATLSHSNPPQITTVPTYSKILNNSAKKHLQIPKYLKSSESTHADANIEYDLDDQDLKWLQLQSSTINLDFFELVIDKIEKSYFKFLKSLPKKSLLIENTPFPEETVCKVCDDSEAENSNAIVFCDGCNLSVHQDCYGIPFIPEGQWLCRKCMLSPESPVTCALCPVKTGAFKQTNNNQWAHLLCAMWVPECRIANTVFMGNKNTHKRAN